MVAKGRKMTMANSEVEAAFREYLHRIELNPARVALASKRYGAIKKQLESELSGALVKQVGSFQRKTKIRPESDNEALDIDVLVVFATAHEFSANGLSPADGLKRVKGGLTDDGTYEAMRPRTDAPVVTLVYADGFRFELIPAYQDRTGRHTTREDPPSYLVATNDGWCPNDYDYDARAITAINQSAVVRGKVVPLIKILKKFNRIHDIPLTSFHVELLVATKLVSRLKEWQAKGYTWGYRHMVAEFFSGSAGVIGQSLQVPDSVTPPYKSDLSLWTISSIRKRYEEFGSRAWRLCEAEADLLAWAKFMGDPFPKFLPKET